jgi:hypothetical protein
MQSEEVRPEARQAAIAKPYGQLPRRMTLQMRKHNHSSPVIEYRNALIWPHWPRLLRLKATLLALCLVILIAQAPEAFASSQPSSTQASSAVGTAFAAVQAAGRDGGNVSSLVAQLNGALVLIQEASSENSSNPAKAASDLNSALAIAEGVQASAATAAQQGMAARQLQFGLSIGTAAAIVAIAIALYFYGDRIYHRLWLRTYGSHLVKRVG